MTKVSEILESQVNEISASRLRDMMDAQMDKIELQQKLFKKQSKTLANMGFGGDVLSMEKSFKSLIGDYEDLIMSLASEDQD